jgi:O-antigen ligase
MTATQERFAEINNRRWSFLFGSAVALLAGVLGASVALSPSLSLMLLVGAAFAIAIFWQTWYSVLAVLLLRAVLDADAMSSITFPGGMSPSAALGLALIVAGLAYIFLCRVPFDKNLVSLAFLGFLAVSSLSFFEFQRFAGLYDWLRVLSVWVLYVLLVHLLQQRERIEVLVKVLLASSFIPLSVGLYQIVSGTATVAGGFLRVNGTFVWASGYARFLVMMIILAAMLFLYIESKWWKIAGLIYLALMGIALVTTNSRGSWLALAVALLVIAFLRQRKLLPMLLLLGFGLVVMFPAIGERFSDLSTNQNTFITRRLGWEAALASYQNLPVSGLFFGAGWGYLYEFGLSSIGLFGTPIHNDYVRLLVETGAIGLIVYLGIYAIMAYHAFRNLTNTSDKYLETLNLVFIGVLIIQIMISATDGSVIVSPGTEFYFWSFAAISQAIFTLNRQNKTVALGAP